MNDDLPELFGPTNNVMGAKLIIGKFLKRLKFLKPNFSILDDFDITLLGYRREKSQTLLKYFHNNIIYAIYNRRTRTWIFAYKPS